MAIPFSGQFTTLATPEEAFDLLADPNKFGPLLPDFQSMTQEDATHFTVRLNVGVGNLKGTTAINMELREATRSHRVLYHGKGNAFGNQISLEIGFDLTSADVNTVVAWHGEADIVGKLAVLAGGMLEPLAGKGMSKLMDGLKTLLTQRRAVEASEAEQFGGTSVEGQPLAPSTQSPLSETGRPVEPGPARNDGSQ